MTKPETRKKPNIKHKKQAHSRSHQISLKDAIETALTKDFPLHNNIYFTFINPPLTGHNTDGYWQHHQHISHKMPLPHHYNRPRQPQSGRRPGAAWK